jgi:hypothetical protein
MSDKGWLRRFDEPIVAPDGTQLRTLREAIKYLAETVPQGERDMPAVATAAEMLTYAAERETAWMLFARIGVMRALNRHVERVFNPDRKDHQ